MIAIVHSIYSQSVHAPALDAGLMDNDAERYCKQQKIHSQIPCDTTFHMKCTYLHNIFTQ